MYRYIITEYRYIIWFYEKEERGLPLIKLTFYILSEYLRILNGNGSVVLNQYGYSSAAQTKFLEVDFGNSNNITVRVYLSYYYSHFKLQYGIMKQGIQSGQ